jgi:hypothetical protein
MKTLKQLVFLFAIAAVLVSCGNATADGVNATDDQFFETELKPPIRPEEPAVANPELLSEKGFMGILPGASVQKLGGRLEKGTLENGASRFQVYHVKDADGARVGYALPDRNDSTRVGDIVVTSPEFIDGKGIGVGGTWGELKTAYPNIVAYGSKMESRVYAVNAPLSYRLDYANGKYEFNNGEIPEITKITAIELRR